MPAPPRGALLGTLVLSAVLGLSAVVFAVLAAAHSPKPAWFMLGFELVLIVAAVMGVLTGLGRFRDGPAMAVASVAGVTLVAALLGFQGAGRQLFGHSLVPLVIARELLALFLAAMAAWIVLARRLEKSAPAFLRGIGLGILVLLLLGAGWYFRASITGSGVLSTIVAVAGFVLITGLLAASVHLLVRAFQYGRVGPAPTHCPKCGYDISASPPGPCPECGAPGVRLADSTAPNPPV